MENILNHIKRHGNMEKSKYDNNSYRGLTLPNRMRVLLISDPTTTVAASALSVNIGSFSEPDELPGLANLCSRVLVLGTYKYPIYKGFEKFLSNHDGIHLVSVNGNQSSYYFKINTHHFKDALLQYVQFFLTPLFRKDWIEEEINSLDLDHRKSLSNYLTCLEEFIKYTAKPHHPYKRFSHGNEESLKTIPAQNDINIRRSLLDFFNKYYSANIMSLCVLSNESLNDIEDTIIKLFHEIPYKNITIPYYRHPFRDQNCTKWYIIPKQNTKSLILVFALPELRAEMWFAALQFILTLLEYEGKGSLVALLKEKHLCDALITHQRSCARGMNFLIIEVTTFENEVIYDDIIIEFLFQYLNMINKESKILMPPNESLIKLHEIYIEQIEEYSKKTFHDYKEIINVAEMLPDYSLEEVMFQGRSELNNTCWRFMQYTILLLLDTYLSPKNVNVYVHSKQYEDKINEISPKWNGAVMYKKMTIPKETISKWKNIINTNFHLPIVDEFKEQNSFI